MPATPRRRLAHAALVIHRVDERQQAEPLGGVNAARRDTSIAEPRRPGLVRCTDGDREAHMLHRAQAGPKGAGLFERRALEAEKRIVV
jgi:hypothetical protein